MWGYDGLASSVCLPLARSFLSFLFFLPQSELTVQIVLAILKFREDYGVYSYVKDKNDFEWVIPAIWQLGLGAASLLGLLVGGIGAGFLAKRYGRQLCMALSYGKFQHHSSPQMLNMCRVHHHRRLLAMVLSSNRSQTWQHALAVWWKGPDWCSPRSLHHHRAHLLR
jgi:MFS family permease